MDALGPILFMLTGEANMQIIFRFILFQLAQPTHYWFVKETDEIPLLNGSNNAHLLWLNMVIYCFVKSWLKLGCKDNTNDIVLKKIKHLICLFLVFHGTLISRVLLIGGEAHSLICQWQFGPCNFIFEVYCGLYLVYICGALHFNSFSFRLHNV